MNPDYEYLLEQFYRGLLGQERGEVVIDVGAHRGRHSAVFSELLGDDGHLVLIEPIPECQDVLLQSVCKDASCSVSLIKGAASKTRGNSQFTLAVDRPEESGIVERPWFGGETRIKTLDIQLYTLDEIMRGVEGRAAFVKIDVEGGEYDVILGSQSILKAHRPIVSFEHSGRASMAYGNSSEDLYDLFASLGYELMTLRGERPTSKEEFALLGTGTSVWDFVALPREMAPDVILQTQLRLSENYWMEVQTSVMVGECFQKILHRQPSQNEIRKLTMSVRRTSPGTFLSGLVHSPEFKALQEAGQD